MIFHFLILLFLLPICFFFVSEEFAMALAFAIYFLILFQFQPFATGGVRSNLPIVRFRILSSVRWSNTLRNFTTLLSTSRPSHFTLGRACTHSAFFLADGYFVGISSFNRPADFPLSGKLPPSVRSHRLINSVTLPILKPRP